jgi:hypothetical protein
MLIFIANHDNFFPDVPEEEKNRIFWLRLAKRKNDSACIAIPKKTPVSTRKAAPEGMTFTFSLLA